MFSCAVVDVLVVSSTGLILCSIGEGTWPGPRCCSVPAPVRAGGWGRGSLLLWRRRAFLPALKCGEWNGPIGCFVCQGFFHVNLFFDLYLLFLIFLLLLFVFLPHCCFQKIILVSTHDVCLLYLHLEGEGRWNCGSSGSTKERE